MSYSTIISGLQKGPAERGHVKKRQKSSKSVKKFFDTVRQFSKRQKLEKASKHFSTLFDYFRAAPFFWPLLGGSDIRGGRAVGPLGWGHRPHRDHGRHQAAIGIDKRGSVAE